MALSYSLDSTKDCHRHKQKRPGGSVGWGEQIVFFGGKVNRPRLATD